MIIYGRRNQQLISANNSIFIYLSSLFHSLIVFSVLASSGYYADD